MSDESSVTIDIGRLAEYVDKVGQLGSVSKMMGPVYLKDFIEGQDLAGELLSKAVQADVKAKARLEQAEAVAYFDKAPGFLQSRQVKDSSEARKKYVDVDPTVIAAKDQKAKTEAMVALFKNKLSILRQAHDDLKKIVYGDMNQTPFEGM